MARIFISYRRDDTGGYAGRLFDRLSTHFGRGNIFMDVDTIEPGLDFVRAIERAVGSCDVLLALIGQQWSSRRLHNDQDFIRLEIATALKRDIRVIPLLIHRTPMPSVSDLPNDLRALTRRNALELSDAHFHRDVDSLIATLDRVLRVTPSPSSHTGAPRTAPTAPSSTGPAGQSSSPQSKKFWGIMNISLSFVVYGLSVLVLNATGGPGMTGLSGLVSFLSFSALVMLIVGIVQLVQHAMGSGSK